VSAPPSDSDLLRSAATDPDAFGELVRRHRDRLWAVALRTTADREDAADALQEAFVSAYRACTSGTAASGFRGESAVTTWLHRIVVNACLDRIRRRNVRAADPLPEAEPADPAPDAIAARETALDVRAALALLPAEMRAALVLVDMYGWSVQDAAEVLDCPTGTVKSRCARGRARLLPLLHPEPGNQPEPGRVPSPTPVPPTTSTEGRQP
jgi:RNA polymerase sigma-70 factor (ECF subfamily)